MNAQRERFLNEPPQSVAWWDALFSWANEEKESILLHPKINEKAWREEIRSTFERRASELANSYTEAVLTLRPRRVRILARTARLAVPRSGLFGAWQFVEPTFIFSPINHPNIRWNEKGRRRFLLWGQEQLPSDRVAPHDPIGIRGLYERHPSNNLAQRWFIEISGQLEAVSDKAIPLGKLGRIRNSELRQALVRLYGVKTKRPAIQRDDYGELYNVDEDTNAVHVTCPSTGRMYWIGVPASCETAREAVLWSFELDKETVTALQET